MNCSKCGKEMEGPAPLRIRFAGWNWTPKELDILHAEMKCTDCLFKKLNAMTDSEIHRFKERVARGETTFLDEINQLKELEEKKLKEKLCKICGKRAVSKGMCKKHYNEEYLKEKRIGKKVGKLKIRIPILPKPHEDRPFNIRCETCGSLWETKLAIESGNFGIKLIECPICGGRT